MLPYNWKESFKPSNLRNTINENSMGVAIVMVVLLIVGIWLIWPKGPDLSIGSSVYLIDEDTGEVSKASADVIPPLIGKAGKPSVVAVVYYTCTSCSDKKAAFYRKYTDAVKALKEKHKNDKPGDAPISYMEDTMMRNGTLVRSPTPGSPWVMADSPQGGAVVQNQPCPTGQEWKLCFP